MADRAHVYVGGADLMALDQLLWECFRHFVHLDHANAAIHCAQVRYSPITFKLAEALHNMEAEKFLHPFNEPLLAEVLAHRGAYVEDTGR